MGQIAENKGENISETQLKTILNKYFEEISEDLPEDLSETTITLTTKEEYGGYTNIALADIYNGKLKIELRSTIDYGEKTAETVTVNDDITIGTEKFKVIKKSADGKTITALPYYNITLPEDLTSELPVQSRTAGVISFSDSNYWGDTSVNEIDMSGGTTGTNYIQPYIEAYEKTLHNLGTMNVRTRVAIISEMNTTDMTRDLRMPLRVSQRYWLGSSSSNNANSVLMVDQNGNCGTNGNNYGNTCGVRPIVIIEISNT